jgi:hypothetical protein
MSSAARHFDLHFFGPAKACPKEPGLLRRIFDALIEQDQGRSDREMAGILARSGGRFTDAMEREMFQRQYASNWWLQ